MKKYIEKDKAVSIAHSYCHTKDGQCCGPDDVIELYEELQYIPTADVEEVRHGQWIDVNGDGSLWRCCICGETQCCKSNYCGECGAKMDRGTMMRLIDGNGIGLALVKRGQSDKRFKLGDTIRYTPSEVQQIINEDIPTVDAVEVQHGKWECVGKYGFKYRCTECFSGLPYITSYCPNCGAKMDGGINE